jgi:polar amino acid transport system substrate-binding protein
MRDQSLRRHQTTGTIRIGYAIEPPYALLKPGGKVSGLFPDSARWLTTTLGIAQIEWVQTDFDALIPGLEAGRFDLVAAGMYHTPERAERVAFSAPLVQVEQGLLVRTGNPQQINAYADALARTDLRFAVIAGAVEGELLRRIGLAEHQLLLVPDATTGLVAVESGVVAGLALSAPTIRWMAAQDDLGATELAQPFIQPDPALIPGLGQAAFAFRQTDRQLLHGWNQAMMTFAESAAHHDLLAEFGFISTEIPETSPLPLPERSAYATCSAVRSALSLAMALELGNCDHGDHRLYLDRRVVRAATANAPPDGYHSRYAPPGPD